MPIYEFKCKKYKNIFESLIFSPAKSQILPHAHQPPARQVVLQAAAIKRFSL
jgi:hypothetical protein